MREFFDSSVKLSRRAFIGSTWLGGMLGLVGLGARIPKQASAGERVITIAKTASDYEREPLIQPFGFKGGYLTELWQTVAYLRSASGVAKAGLATQSVLWSDAEVFASCSEVKGNELMYAMTGYALRLLEGKKFNDPVALLEEIIEDVYQFGRKLTGRSDLRRTFVLNALVGVDNAAWLLYAAENGIGHFDELIPTEYRNALSRRHQLVAAIPLISYNVSLSEIEKAASEGFFFLKIKIGHPGGQDEMLRKDVERLEAIHNIVKDCRTPHTNDNRVCYYLDANGRYQNRETLLRLVRSLERSGALERVVMIEEPFPEDLEEDVRNIPVRIAADESAHTDRDARKRIEMGYGAIALKPIAKTLSMTLKIADLAHRHRVPCFCADLTVNPILVDWNRNVAARLEPFPGLEVGLLETNGHQNYADWERMREYHPCPQASWQDTREGVFHLGRDFYRKSGGVLIDSPHYLGLFENF